MLLLLVASIGLGESVSSHAIRSVDFRNYTYSIVQFEAEDADSVTLVDGKFKFPYDPDVSPGIRLHSVKYGDLNGDGIEEALVVLRYDNGGSALHYDFVFVFRVGSDGPTVWYSRMYEAATAESFSGGSVVVKSPLWLPSDAHCCPTYNARYMIRVSAGKPQVVSRRLYRIAKGS